jgi:hypothetical protein
MSLLLQLLKLTLSLSKSLLLLRRGIVTVVTMSFP